MQAGIALWWALRVGPEPEVTLDTEYAAVGAANLVTARFSEPQRGLARVRLELTQGDRTEILDERRFTPGRGIPLVPDGGTPEATLEATVGTDAQPWLEEGAVVLRAVADRATGPLRSVDPVVVERTVPVRLRPPRLEVLSSQHYVRQGGSGAVVYRVGDTVVRSGVRAGDGRVAGLSPRRGRTRTTVS